VQVLDDKQRVLSLLTDIRGKCAPSGHASQQGSKRGH